MPKKKHRFSITYHYGSKLYPYLPVEIDQQGTISTRLKIQWGELSDTLKPKNRFIPKPEDLRPPLVLVGTVINHQEIFTNLDTGRIEMGEKVTAPELHPFFRILGVVVFIVIAAIWPLAYLIRGVLRRRQIHIVGK